MANKEIIGLLLAGGQGSRLGILTTDIAKPAVPYGGKYRIIDFPLSNCVNSGIDTVGVFTQYQPLELNEHVGIGKPWDLDRNNGGVTILSPYMKSENSDWFKGTANAVFQNIHYIDKQDPEYVVILSGDHIYKMDYSLMLDEHKKNEADATISVFEVPLDEASRFGIMNADETGKIYEFEEKPKQPKSTLASMGVYIFTWKALRNYLIEDDADAESDNDFGKNIIPKMLDDGLSLYAYNFEGYWKDVGTIQAYWESNMDLVKLVPEFDMFDSKWRTFTVNPVMPPNFVGEGGSVKGSIVGEGCMVYGTVENSVIFPGVYIEAGAYIKDSIVMSGCHIAKDTIVLKTIICEDTKIEKDVVIGEGEDIPNNVRPDLYNSGITVIGERAIIPESVHIGKNVVINNETNKEDYKNLEVISGSTIVKGE